MINYPLNQIPARSAKPREEGLTMIMDKGLSIREAEDFLSVGAEYTDVVKLGWATSAVTPNLKDKLAVYKAHNIPFYFGGTSLLILVGVAIDFLQQVQAQLLSTRYENLMKGARIKSRRVQY